MKRICIFAIAVAALAAAQTPIVQPGAVLDPSRVVRQVRTVGSFHKPLPEEYIWTADDAAVAVGAKQLSQLKLDTYKVEPHDFRKSFELNTKPEVATLYVAGPRRATVWVNGTKVAEMQYAAAHHMGFGTMTADVGSALRVGTNVIAVEAVRGGGSHHHTNALKTSWLNSGEILAVKLVGAALGEEAPALLTSDALWKSAVDAKPGWEQAAFEDAGWKRVVSLGGIESSPDFFQWNADAGIYAWPGYLGEAPYMANYRMQALAPKRVDGGVLLDFGRELNGRIVIVGGAQGVKARMRMGESMGELMNAPYLGEIALAAPANGEARGPKTGFRYALVNVDEGAMVYAEGIYYPAPQIGAFESNDLLVNKIFETAVYTAHLSMQDSILDGIKRDRGRWIGDDEVINRVALDVYGNVPLVKEGLKDAIGPEPVTEAVGGLPGYSAWWVVAEYEYVTRTGDMEQLRGVKTRMLQLLALMEKDLDDRNVYAGKGKPFVDWSKGFSGESPEARRAVDFEYMRAFRLGGALLHRVKDDANGTRYMKLAADMSEATRKYLRDANRSYGDRWQTNALAVLGEDHEGNFAFGTHATLDVLKRVANGRKPGDVITPYFGSYLLQALSRADMQPDALSWMKSYWSGMLDNGATSFWEAWDPAWAGDDPHAKLEADDKVGYNASLAHGWSSGPAAWLLEEVLGIQCEGSIVDEGCREVAVRPHLAGLKWVKGSEWTPNGAVEVEASEKRIVVVIPAGIEADVTLPIPGWMRDGKPLRPTSPVADVLTLKTAGRYEFVKQ